MALLMAIFICSFSNSPVPLASAQRPKILCLHGGGGNQNSMAAAVADIENALPEYEFVYVNGAYGGQNNYLWVNDPPGGKGEPTTDPGWADESIQVLDDVVEAQGPFHGILGYSQGAAFVPVYLSRVPNDTFQMAITFCGYLTNTHLGLLGRVRERSPFGDIVHLVWMGGNDSIISNPMTREMAEEFAAPTIVKSNSAGHIVPASNDPTFNQVVSWIRDNSNPGPPPSPPTANPPTRAPSVPTPTPVCSDNCSFRFDLDRSPTQAQCSWITKNRITSSARKAKYCGRSVIKSNCPATCDSNCANDQSFTFTLRNTGTNVKCNWMTRNRRRAEIRKENYCGNVFIASSCPSACGRCPYF